MRARATTGATREEGDGAGRNGRHRQRGRRRTHVTMAQRGKTVASDGGVDRGDEKADHGCRGHVRLRNEDKDEVRGKKKGKRRGGNK